MNHDELMLGALFSDKSKSMLQLDQRTQFWMSGVVGHAFVSFQFGGVLVRGQGLPVCDARLLGICQFACGKWLVCRWLNGALLIQQTVRPLLSSVSGWFCFCCPRHFAFEYNDSFYSGVRVCFCERVLRSSHMHSVQCNKCYLDSAHCQSACRLEGPRFGIWFPIIIFKLYQNLVSGLRFCVLFQAIFMLFLGRMIPTIFLAQAGSHPTAAQCLARPGLDLPIGLVWPCGWKTMEQCDEHQIHPNTLRGWSMGCWEFPN